jgi:MATE family multidrug resistance protein
VWAIAGPAIIANSSAPIVGLVDTWAIGHLPKAEYLAAIAVGSTIFTYIFWAFGFLRMGTTGHAAQAHGRSDQNSLRQLVIRSTATGLIIAALILVLQGVIFDIGLLALAPPSTVIQPLTDYYDFRIWSAPFTLFLYTANGFLIGTSKAKTALILQLILNVANMALNLVFVIGLDMGVSGVALGTLLAEIITASAALIIILKHLGYSQLVTVSLQKTMWKLEAFIPLMSTNFYLMVRTLLLITALSLVTREAGHLGENQLAASQILSTFFMLISLGLDGFAYLAEALAGAAYGAKNRSAFELWVRIGFYWAIATALLYTLVFWLFGSYIINILTDIPSIRLEAYEALLAIIIMPVAAVWCFQFDGVYIGATASKAMMVTMAVAFITFIFLYQPLTNVYGLTGLWSGLAVFMLVRGISQAIYYPRLKAGLKP